MMINRSTELKKVFLVRVSAVTVIYLTDSDRAERDTAPMMITLTDSLACHRSVL